MNDDSESEHNLLHIKYLVKNSEEFDNKQFLFKQIKQHLNKKETYDTLTYERWKYTVKCVSCKSSNVKKLSDAKDLKRYQCLDCHEEFSDVSGTPIDDKLSSIAIWVETWYLIGIGTPLAKISEILKIDTHILKYMVLELKKLFGEELPLNKLNETEKFRDIISIIKKNVKALSLKYKKEIEQGYSAGQEVDSAELRRQRLRATNSPNKK